MTERFALRRYVVGDADALPGKPELAAEAELVRAALKADGGPSGQSWTLTDRGRPVACGGVCEIWAGRWLAWTWTGAIPFRARCMVAAACRGALELAADRGARRIEAHTPWGFAAGRRFLDRLGFQLEGRARRWGPDGSDYAAFALIVEEPRP